MSEQAWKKGTRKCAVCHQPTGSKFRQCPGCLRAAVFIREAHTLGNSRGEAALHANDPAHEARVRAYRRRAAKGLPLFD